MASHRRSPHGSLAAVEDEDGHDDLRILVGSIGDIPGMRGQDPALREVLKPAPTGGDGDVVAIFGRTCLAGAGDSRGRQRIPVGIGCACAEVVIGQVLIYHLHAFLNNPQILAVDGQRVNNFGLENVVPLGVELDIHGRIFQ